MSPTLATVLAVVAAYLLGSLSFAVIVSRLMGLQDPRTYGSGNPGATNVLRGGGKKAAALTLLFDALKGLAPVLLVRVYGAQAGLGEGTMALVGLAAFIGHLWPVFFAFKGGKGVATAAGVLLGLQPWLGLAVVALWLLVAWASRYSSLAALTAALSAPVLQLLGWDAGPIFFVTVVMTALLVWRHSRNISNLLAGKEGKIGSEPRTSTIDASFQIGKASGKDHHGPHAHHGHHEHARRQRQKHDAR